MGIMAHRGPGRAAVLTTVKDPHKIMFTQFKSLMNTSQSNSLKAGPEAGAGPAGKEGESDSKTHRRGKQILNNPERFMRSGFVFL